MFEVEQHLSQGMLLQDSLVDSEIVEEQVFTSDLKETVVIFPNMEKQSEHWPIYIRNDWNEIILDTVIHSSLPQNRHSSQSFTYGLQVFDKYFIAHKI